MQHGQIIIVNGTSAAGKTTTITTFGQQSDEPYMMFGIDQLMGQILPVKFSGFGDRAQEGWHMVPQDPDDDESPLITKMGDVLMKALGAMHEMIAAASRAGQSVIVDHVMFMDPPVLQDCIWRLEGLPVTFVCLKPPKEVLLERQLSRKVDLPDQYAEELGDEARAQMAQQMKRMIPWFYDASYENDIYDIVIDTTKHDPNAVCKLIEEQIATGPGTAFDALRARYPKK